MPGNGAHGQPDDHRCHFSSPPIHRSAGSDRMPAPFARKTPRNSGMQSAALQDAAMFPNC
jgi:hypothetical protein